jgi:hypothetical protein
MNQDITYIEANITTVVTFQRRNLQAVKLQDLEIKVKSVPAKLKFTWRGTSHVHTTLILLYRSFTLWAGL